MQGTSPALMGGFGSITFFDANFNTKAVKKWARREMRSDQPVTSRWVVSEADGVCRRSRSFWLAK